MSRKTTCSACGKSVEAWNYCSNCGASLSEESQSLIEREYQWSSSGPHIGSLGASGDLDDYRDLEDVIGE